MPGARLRGAAAPALPAVEAPDVSFQNLVVEEEFPDYLDTQPLEEKFEPATARPEAIPHAFFEYGPEPLPAPAPPDPHFQWIPHSQPLEAPEEYLRSASSQPLNAQFAEAMPAFAVPPNEALAEVSHSGALASSSPDPWADPLPAWETSRNEYPVLVHATGSHQSSRWKFLLAILLLLVSIVVCYLVVFRPGAQEQVQSVAKPEPPRPVQPDNGVKDPPPVEKTATTPQPPPTNAEPGGQGAISLQALSSPSEKEAKEFADKLVRAGVSAYVVSADLKEKGRWYRVRVGRFSTREESARYAEQARARAKAAGLKLNLITVDYEKP
jgi:hypothetical protein